MRNCIIISINRSAYDHIRAIAKDKNFIKLALVGQGRARRQFLLELVVRFVVYRHTEYKNGLDVHEYLDKGIVSVAENKSFDWNAEADVFKRTMKILLESYGETAFKKNNRFSLGMYEFLCLGLSSAIEKGINLDNNFVKLRVEGVQYLDESKRYSGIGVRGTQRLAKFVMPLAPGYFVAPQV
jgi:hypothetical protein